MIVRLLCFCVDIFVMFCCHFVDDVSFCGPYW